MRKRLGVACTLDSLLPNYIFGLNSASTAPVGSVKMLNHPTLGISVTSLIKVAPSDLALAVEALMSSTATYASQNDGAPGMGAS